jgi:hypothetical protein
MSAFEGIVLQNSQNAARQFSRPKMKQATIAHSYDVRLITEVVCEFITG